MSTEDEPKTPSLEALSKQLELVEKLKPASSSGKKLPGDAARGAIDFASATAVGVVLGYGFDVWQHTMPWGILVGLLIGTAAGLKLLFQEEARQKKRDAETKQPTDKET